MSSSLAHCQRHSHTLIVMSTLPVITNGADLWKSETKVTESVEKMICQDDPQQFMVYQTINNNIVG